MKLSSIVKRAGHIDQNATLLRAAVIAAHAVHVRNGVFRAVDVRFFFRLFSNWIEHDIVRPSLDIELTQVRRFFEQLRAEQRLIVSGYREFALTSTGLLDLEEKLVDECGTSF
ncbi:MAG: hypothetical protein H7Z43_04225 [Clostridia bacterium]|nr:hypothetical protein [Deltaproteobacteria bacterium]